MTIVFATNDAADFPGADINTATTIRRTDYVSKAFQTTGGNVNFTVIATTIIPPVAGDITWIHFQYAIGEINKTGNGNLLFELRSGTGAVIMDFDLTGGDVSCRLFGSSTLDVDLTNNLIGNVLRAIDIKIDLTSDISVEVYDNGALVYNESQAWTSSPGNPEFIYWRTKDIVNGNRSQYVSELIIADESTIGMGLTEMIPDSNGNYSDWDGDHVETGDNDLGTGASSDIVGEKLSSVMTAFAGPTSSALRALVVSTKASTHGGKVNDLRNFLRISATDYDGSTLGITEGVRTHVEVWDTNPNTSVDWDSADFAGTEIGTESLA